MQDDRDVSLVTVCLRNLQRLLVERKLLRPIRLSGRKMGKSNRQPPRVSGTAEDLDCFFQQPARPLAIAARLGHVGRAEERTGPRRRRDGIPQSERTVVPALPLVELAAVPPETPQRPRQPERTFAVSRRARERERRA